MNKGVSFRPPKAQVSKEFIEVYNRCKQKEITAAKTMKEASVKKTTFYNLVKVYESTLNIEIKRKKE